MRLVEIGLPLALSCVSILLTLRYPLTEARCYEIKEALKRGVRNRARAFELRFVRRGDDLRLVAIVNQRDSSGCTLRHQPFIPQPHDSRTTSSASSEIFAGGRSGSAIRWHNSSIAVAPMLRHRHAHRRQQRLGHLGDPRVVEADDAQIARHG